MLVAPILMLLSSRSADAVTLCLPKADENACIAGTMGSRADPIEGVDVILTKPDGTTETQTTEEDGKFAFSVTEPGNYLVGVDPDTLPDGSELRPPADANLRGPDGTIKVDNVQLGKSYGPVLTVRAADFDDSTNKWDEFLQSSVNGIRLGLLLALASVGLSLIYGTTGLSNFAHAEQVTLGGMVGYGLINVAGMPLVAGGVLVVIICGFSGWFQDRILWQPLRRRGLGLTQLMIVTIGLSLALQYSFQYIVGARTVRIVTGQPHGPRLRLDPDHHPVAVGDGDLDRGAGAGRLRAAAHPRRPGHPCGVRQPGAGAGLGHRHRQGDPAGLDGGHGAGRSLRASSTRWWSTASSGTPASRSCCCSSRR